MVIPAQDIASAGVEISRLAIGESGFDICVAIHRPEHNA
jgi:hypothetical protein